MKAIVIGASLSGKTTIVRQLLRESDILILEIDEELTRMNNGDYPTDDDQKHNILVPRIVRDILDRQNIIFFTNTDYFSIQDLQIAKENGFKILMLKVGLKELRRRNKNRIEKEGYDDLGKYLEGMIDYLKKVERSGLADVVSGEGSVDEVLGSVKSVLNIK